MAIDALPAANAEPLDRPSKPFRDADNVRNGSTPDTPDNLWSIAAIHPAAMRPLLNAAPGEKILKLLALALAGFLAVSMPALARPASSPIYGVWENPKHSVKVEMKPCGNTLCGVVVWASAEAQADAAAAGTEQLVGVELLSDYRQVGPRSWEGTMYVPDLKGQYSSQMELVGPNTVEISGCALGHLLCKSQTWARVAPARAVKRARQRRR